MRVNLLALTALVSLGSASALFAQDEADGASAPAPAQAQKTPARPAIYDEAADARKQIDAALASARKENRRVLIQWGANWCGWCHLLHEHFEKEKDVRRKLLYEYDVVLVDIGRFDKNLDLAKQYGASFQDSGVPFLTVLGADGAVIANQETGSLESKVEGVNGHDAEKVLAFLSKHQAEYLPAESILGDALRRARAEEKMVFLHFGAPWCGWCHRLEDWLARPEVARLVAKDFIDVKLDTERTIGGQAMLERMTKGVPGGIPWFAFLDADGRVVADSFVQPGENLGHPFTDEETAAFAALLTRVADRLSPAEIRTLVDDLRATNAKKSAKR